MKTTLDFKQATVVPRSKNEMALPKITKTAVIVGLGYVGLPLALLARERGFRVTGVDTSEDKRRQIKNATIPDIDENPKRLLQEKPLAVSGSFEAVADADIVVVCVPTPVDENHEPDLTPVEITCKEIARHLRSGQLIILESTVHPGTAEEVVIPLLERNSSGLKAGKDFGVAHCPERINPGDHYWTLERVPRVVGATSVEALAVAASFYRSILSAPVREMATIREAEAVKMVENCFRDINIAFVNELAMSFDKLGIDVTNVLDGASTKPYGFMRHSPGCGVGGHCIPVDPYYLIRYAQKNGFSHDFLSLARRINNGMPAYTVKILREELRKKNLSLKSGAIALLGLSYKANLSDLRESPSLQILEMLEEEGADVRVFDPFAPKLSNVESLDKALSGANAIVITTAHDAFKTITPKQLKDADVGIVIDGRNCLPKKDFLLENIVYRGIGR